MTKPERALRAIANSKRSGQVIVADDAAIADVFAKAQVRVMVQAGLVEGDEVEFHTKVFGKIADRVNKALVRDLPALTATVYKKDDAGGYTEEDRVIFIAGLIRQDPDKGVKGIIASEEDFANATTMDEFANAFLNIGRIRVAAQWTRKSENVMVAGVKTDITSKHFELVKA